MRTALLTFSILLMTGFYSMATNEKLSVLQSDAVTGDYWEVDTANLGVQVPCTDFMFKIQYTAPTGYTVKQFDWYVNNVFLKTTPATQDQTDIHVTALRTAVVCKVIYQKTVNGTTTTTTSASPVFALHGNSLNLVLNGPSSVNILPQTASYSVTTGGPSFAFTPPPGSYTTTWQAPAGWTAGTPMNNGNNISFTTDDYTAGTVTATSTYTACGYAQSMHLNVTRIYPAPTFPSSDAPRICGSALGETTTFVYSINPVAGAVNYTYTLHNNPSGVPDNISFDGTGGQTTLTTTSTSVTLACSSTQNQVLALDVIAHFPDNGTSGAEFIFDYAILWWTPTYTWYGCFNEQGTAVSAVANPDFPGAYYFWYLDGFLIDEGYANTTTWLWRGEHFLQVKATTECGETELYGETVPSQGCYNTFAPNNLNNSLTVYPNPASGLINIQVKRPGKNAKASDAAFKDIREIRVMDKLGNVKKISRFGPGSRTITLDLSNLPNDVYILQASDGSNKVSLHVAKIN